MNSSLRFGTALSALALAGMLTGCATGQRRQYAKANTSAAAAKVGLATRAQVALASGDFATAVRLAELAVQHGPNQAAFRMVLGNAYFSAGRFASAEAAYRDSLSLAADQPEVVLKLALAKIAQGKNAPALADLEAARNHLEAADYGLALALAGQPADAVAVLGHAARQPGADARLRQNLALAHALSGDWTMARTIAEQDVGPDQLDLRIQHWMAMATPARASDQVAALTGVTPSIDPGQPVHLALNQALAAPRMAQAAPVPQPVQQYVAPEPVGYVEPQVAAFAEPEPQPQAVAEVLMQPVVEASAAVDPLPTRFEAEPEAPKFIAVAARKPARASGRSNSVVQLGAYGSPQRVAAAWNQLARRYGALGRYTPVSARFSGPSGTVYRLSVKGFASASEAQRLCGALQRKGGNCFVRRVAGDAPVQLASR
jgi:Flp pilus assembly protein TadD